MKKIFESWTPLIIVGLITCFIVVSFSLLLLFWMTYPYQPVTINHVDTITKEVEAGGQFYYDVDYCKHMSLPTTVNTKFIDGLVFNVPEYTLRNSIGCKTDHVVQEVPEFFEGTYHVETLLSYKVNPIRTVYVKIRTDNFEVVKPCDNECNY